MKEKRDIRRNSLQKNYKSSTHVSSLVLGLFVTYNILITDEVFKNTL
jgi:hypothetical protein